MPRVTIGVPVYKGEDFLAEALHKIQNQTFQDFEVHMSVDGPDPVCEDICAAFTADPRFKLFVQPQRLGWVGNINWLLSKVETEFWYFHQQDDLTHETYVEKLLSALDQDPSTALAYCDLAPGGRLLGQSFEQEPSVLGETPYLRVMTMLHQHLVAFPMRGLVRRDAIRMAGPIPANAVRNYGVDITWITGLARSGKLLRVPQTLYWKRYHDNNTESGWWAWPQEKKLEAWSHHCADMLNQALYVRGSVSEDRLLWLAAVERLTSVATARTFVDLSGLTARQYRALLADFLKVVKRSPVHDIPVRLDMTWWKIRLWTRAFYWIPRAGTARIRAFGPRSIEAGERFNLQPDGRSALWLEASRALAPDTRVRLGDVELQTVIAGNLATASVPSEVVESPGELPLRLTAPDGTPRSRPVTLTVRPPAPAA